MKIIVACPNGHRFRVDDVHRGKTVQCPHQGCGVEFVIEAVGEQPQSIPPSAKEPSPADGEGTEASTPVPGVTPLPPGSPSETGAGRVDVGVPAVTPVGEPPEPAGLPIGEALSQGWRVMSTHYGVLLGATLIYFAIEAAIGVGGVVPCAGVLLSIASLLISPVLAAGWSFMGVMAYRGRPLRVADLFCGFNRIAHVFGIAMLQAAIILGCLLPAGVAIGIAAFLLGAAAPTDDAAMTGGIVIGVAGGLVSLVACVYVGLRLMFSTQVCLETGLGIGDSMRRSWRGTQRFLGKLLLLTLVLSLISIATAALCVLPYFFLGLPLMIAVMGAAYGMVFPYAGLAVGPRGFEVQVSSGGTGAVGV